MAHGNPWQTLWGCFGMNMGWSSVKASGALSGRRPTLRLKVDMVSVNTSRHTISATIFGTWNQVLAYYSV